VGAASVLIVCGLCVNRFVAYNCARYHLLRFILIAVRFFPRVPLVAPDTDPPGRFLAAAPTVGHAYPQNPRKRVLGRFGSGRGASGV